MVDLQTTVCAMCGDVGFPDKLFRCIKCFHRFQHSYCSNYYSEASGEMELCDWCKSEERAGTNSKRAAAVGAEQSSSRSEYSGDRIKRQDQQREEGGAASDKGRSHGGVPSPRAATRRYKLLKDVMC